MVKSSSLLVAVAGLTIVSLLLTASNIEAFSSVSNNNNYNNANVASVLPTLPRLSQHDDCSVAMLTQLGEMLVSCEYTNAKVAELVGVDPHCCCCPIYLRPLGPTDAPPPLLQNNTTTATTPLQDLVKAFLLGICLMKDNTALPLELLASFKKLGWLIPKAGLLVPTIQIFPLDLPHRTLHIITDWHPRVLQSTLDDQAVMYVGPDSLALVHHWWLSGYPNFGIHGGQDKVLLDIASGSGIQALVGLAMGMNHAIAVDVNPRALGMARQNAALNGLQAQFETIQANVVTDQLAVSSSSSNKNNNNMTTLTQLLKERHYHVVTANPPFIPMPPHNNNKSQYGWFSSVDPRGDAVLKATLRLAQKAEVAAIVSEFFWKHDPTELSLQVWKSTNNCYSWILTNEVPLSVETYARRRALNNDYESWRAHLQKMEMEYSSPGLLFVWPQRPGDLQHLIVPKSPEGSIWTPTNHYARKFVHTFLKAQQQS